MKNLILNIFKTLFFFDLALIVADILPELALKSIPLSTLLNEIIFLVVIILFTVIFLTVVEKKKLGFFKTKKLFTSYSIGLVSAIIPLALSVLIMWVLGLISFKGINGTKDTLLWLGVILVNTVSTELLLRGYLFKLYRKFYSFPITCAIITFLFVALDLNHFKNGIFYILNVLILNLLLCILTEKTNSIIAPITAHFAFNTVNMLLLGGGNILKDCPSVLNIVTNGKKFLSGGEIGLEGSIIFLIFNISVCAYFVIKPILKNKKR